MDINVLGNDLPNQVDFDRDYESVVQDLFEDINTLGDIRVQVDGGDFDGLLLFPDFCRISKLIKKYTHPIMVPSLQALIKKRRQALKKGLKRRYRELAHMSNELEENFTQRISEVILDSFKIEQEVFFESWKRGLEFDEANHEVLNTQ